MTTTDVATDITDITRLGPWFHNLHLPDGRQTCTEHALGDFPRWKWREIAEYLPADLSGKRVLDIGCNAGFYSFVLAGRGATVTAIDHDEHYLKQARWAQPQLDPEGRVRFAKADVYDVLRVKQSYDWIWFMGVLYHLRYPLLALDAVARRLRPGGTVVFQTLTMPGTTTPAPPENMPLNERRVMEQPYFPKLAFIEHRWSNDPTNWFIPNPAAVEAMLRSSGLVNLRRIADETWLADAPPKGARPPLVEPDRDPLPRITGGEDVIGSA